MALMGRFRHYLSHGCGSSPSRARLGSFPLGPHSAPCPDSAPNTSSVQLAPPPA
uniref:Uncharacterized protein n=1 Tax=Physcomitrium patens TaxID=3218 RepID=A0A2K1IB59_PHYPA|nr:hypothetical protein PHYPA_031097 [Physcomitrium patens]